MPPPETPQPILRSMARVGPHARHSARSRPSVQQPSQPRTTDWSRPRPFLHEKILRELNVFYPGLPSIVLVYKKCGIVDHSSAPWANTLQLVRESLKACLRVARGVIRLRSGLRGLRVHHPRLRRFRIREMHPVRRTGGRLVRGVGAAPDPFSWNAVGQLDVFCRRARNLRYWLPGLDSNQRPFD